jgi:hypothetical protein
MDEDKVTSEFSDGVDAYWSGECPEGWDDPKRRERSPYLSGWYMASMWETSPGYITDGDGYPLQEDEG